MAGTIFLLDLDGVLVDSAGYLRAKRDTINHYTRKMGLGDLAPGSEIAALFESRGMTNEWDMLAIILGLIFDALLAQEPDLDLPADLDQACAAVRARHLSPPSIDYASAINNLSRQLKPGLSPAQAALAACGEPDGECLFPHLSGSPLLTTLLEGAAQETGRSATRIFQQLVLGDELFERVYNAPAEIRGPSYLLRYDRANLSTGLRDELLAGWLEGRLDVVVYTARNSLPPREVDAPGGRYAPEAEIGVRVAGLTEPPLIGFGRLRYLAAQLGTNPQEYVKPSPLQALAAIMAARMRKEWPALRLAAELERRRRQGEALESLHLRDMLGGVSRDGTEAFTAHVFEDSPAGVRAALGAWELLDAAGVKMGLHLWGVAHNPAKEAALSAAGARVFLQADEALQAALNGE